TDALISLQAGPGDDPVFRTILHLLRARWYARTDQADNARRELLWHENWDVFLVPTGDPQAAEVDWAFGALGHWERARLLDRAGRPGTEVCRAYEAVARLWATGEPRYAARADSARRRAAELCRATP
ncbi:MAG: hypothetical protein ACREL9_14740, partial [Gemmatimonadales bacterium]